MRLTLIAAIAHAQRLALMTLTGSAVFTVILIAACAAERQQAWQDLLTQEMRGLNDCAARGVAATRVQNTGSGHAALLTLHRQDLELLSH